jgi:rubredoxin
MTAPVIVVEDYAAGERLAGRPQQQTGTVLKGIDVEPKCPKCGIGPVTSKGVYSKGKLQETHACHLCGHTWETTETVNTARVGDNKTKQKRKTK